ncbi:MAG: hypothetical protein HOP32_05330 [Nitrospira sp.]|nr:hypothetical protein [Nitrospira sp.]
MIGVVANPEEYELVREFFELFKTPWEFYRSEQQYEVVLLAREDVGAEGVSANLVIVYAGKKVLFDEEEKTEIASHRNNGILSYNGCRFPIYRTNITFLNEGSSFLKDEESQQSVGSLAKSGNKAFARIGYDLFQEVRVLLTEGQPSRNADIPTLEIHIAVLRDLIVGSGISLVEIPPIPDGHTFIACLTHDVDHPSIRRHQWDHTMFGFLYRAVIGSVFGVLRGRIPIRHLCANWAAAVRLPFIHLGLAKDIWAEFDRYLEIEKDVDSTFFVLPFKDTPGRTVSGSAPKIRASKYGAADIADRLQTFVSAGREIGLHGIDAWIEVVKGQEEMAQITNITGAKNIGVRMHWLYFDENSPVALERAGFTYDSTVGYNETIGYRAGTTQAYKPLQAHHLLELPLHVMDTALFYPDYLNLSFDEADKQVGVLIDNAVQYGGTVTVNWHDRSLAPERLWGEFYARLLDRLKIKGAWCASAGHAVDWFQKRRAVVFQRVEHGLDVALLNAQSNCNERVPGLRVRVYNSNGIGSQSSDEYSDTVLTTSMNIPLPVGRSIACQ